MSGVQDIVCRWARKRVVEPVKEGRYGGWRGADGATFLVDRGQHDTSGFGRLVLQHPDDGNEAITWRSDFRLATEGKDVEVEVEVRRIDEADESLSNRSNASRPRVLKTLFEEFQCSADSKRLTTESERVSEQDSFSFVHDILINPTRRIPVVVIVENYYGGIFMDPNRLQSRLLGLANVFTYDNGTARSVNREISDRLGCWDGTVRVYRPGCSLDDSPRQNVYWTWGRMNYMTVRHDWEELVMEISDECLRHSLPQAGQRLYDAVSLQVSRAQSERLLGMIKTAALDESTYQELLTDAASNIEDLRGQNDELRQRQVGLEGENDELRSQVEQLGIALSYQEPEDSQLEDDEIQPEFNSVYDVVRHAATHLTGMRFFSLAEQMARGSEFPRPNDVYEVLRRLDDCASERARNSLGKDVQDWLSERGIEYSPHESPTTMGKYGDKRIFHDDVKKKRREMPAHIKIGGGTGEHNQLRIHLMWDDSEEKWLIGYIGRHLPTALG